MLIKLHNITVTIFKYKGIFIKILDAFYQRSLLTNLFVFLTTFYTKKNANVPDDWFSSSEYFDG